MIRKQQPINKQLAAHCKRKGADNPNASWELVRNAVSRTSWYLFQGDKTSITVETLQRVCQELGLEIVILDKETGRTAGGKEVIAPD